LGEITAGQQTHLSPCLEPDSAAKPGSGTREVIDGQRRRGRRIFLLYRSGETAVVAAPLPQRLRPGFLETWKFCLFLERRGENAGLLFFLLLSGRTTTRRRTDRRVEEEELFVEI